jgi:hypothetical protein
VIEQLRRDPTVPPRTIEEWHLSLANVHRRVTEQIAKTIDGYADLDTVLVTIEATI